MAPRLQGGIPKFPVSRNGRRANGLLLRGVVIATYVTDDPGHPQAIAPETQSPVAVYCDVLVLPSLGGERWHGLKNVLVSQEISGLHRGRIWKPRAATIDFLDNLNIEEGTNPAFIDGDHVLVGFLNDNLNQPIILRTLPHPSVDIGREDAEIGRRMKLKAVDGDPDFFRHHGVHWGVDDEGNFSINTNFGNDGVIDPDGKEPPPSGDPAQGNINVDIPLEAKVTIQINDMVDPDNPDPQVIMTYQKDKNIVEIKDAAGEWNLKIENGENLTLEGKDSAAKLTLGDGAVSVADRVETLYGTLKSWLEALTVPTGTGPSGVPINVPAPTWDTQINSDKMLIPDTDP